MGGLVKLSAAGRATVDVPVVPSRVHELFCFASAALTTVALVSLICWETRRGMVSMVAAIRVFGPGLLFSAIFAGAGLVCRRLRVRRKRDLDEFHLVVDQAASATGSPTT